MSILSTRKIVSQFEGDVVADVTNTSTNQASPGKFDIVTLAAGANTITPPSGGTTPVAVTIVPPPSNASTITLKGISGDTGVLLHPTQPTSISLGSPTATFVLTAGAQIVGVQLIWY